MKKVLKAIAFIVVALLITFIVFQNLSWYNFGDIPTKRVKLRLFIFFLLVLFTLICLSFIIKKLSFKIRSRLTRGVN